MKRMLLTAGFVVLLGLTAAQAAGDVQAGKALAAACAGCHGAGGRGLPPNPALAGKSEAQLLEAMKDFKSGKRVNAVMSAMMGPLSDQDMENLAAFYASLK
jgi:cytochrome c553